MKRARIKKLSLLMVLVFAFTAIVPAGAVFADVDIKGTYKYRSTGEEVYAGNVKITKDGINDDTEKMVVQVSLPDGVEFEEDIKNDSHLKEFVDVVDVSGNNIDNNNFSLDFISSKSDYLEFEIENTSGFKVDFNYINISFDTKRSWLNIDDDFAGNLNVDVEVLELNSGGDIVSTDTGSVTIAKVAGTSVDVVIGDVKKVSKGGNKEVADITLEEATAGSFNKGEVVTLEVETDGVEFSRVQGDTVRLKVNNTDNGTAVSAFDTGNNGGFKLTDKNKKFKLEIEEVSKSLPGKIDFNNIRLDIDPDVTGEIEIAVYSNGDADIDETVTVATVGDVIAEVADIDDNDTVAYAGQKTELDVEFTLETTDGSSFKKGDIITFELNKGEFVNFENGTRNNSDQLIKGKGTVKTYRDNEAFYYTCGDNESDELKFGKLEIQLDNDVEPGDVTLTVGGDYGKLGKITIGEVAKPFSVTADKTEIIAESLGQAAGDLYITETDNGAFNKNDEIYVEMPSGVELSKKPKIETVTGSADAVIKSYDDDYFIIEIKSESGSKASEFRVYDLKYDAGKLAITGDVELKFRGHDELGANAKHYEDDSVFTTVANATVVDKSKVTASFTMGDEGVTVKNGRTLVQVNMLSDVLNLQKSWDAGNRVAYFVKSGTTVQFPIDENKIVINGNAIPVDQGGIIENDFTYATLRGIQMAFGGELQWNDATKTATFKFNK